MPFYVCLLAAFFNDIETPGDNNGKADIGLFKLLHTRGKRFVIPEDSMAAYFDLFHYFGNAR
jgi:hypothetical protein